jgi:hypothetical protein
LQRKTTDVRFFVFLYFVLPEFLRQVKSLMFVDITGFAREGAEVLMPKD